MSKKVVAMLATIVVALGAAGLAFAYFTDTGTGTGTATVGHSTDWGVVKASESGTMYPGVGTSTVTFTVTNNGTGHQAIASAGKVTSAIVDDGASPALVKSGGSAVTGCLASWFHAGTPAAVGSPTYPVDLASGATQDYTVGVTMDNTATVNQDACQDVAPDVSMSVAAAG
jgi:hypothetical protein